MICIVSYVLKTFCSLVDSGISTSVDSIEIFNDIVDYKIYARSTKRNNMPEIESVEKRNL